MLQRVNDVYASMSLPLFQEEDSAAEQAERAAGERKLASIEERLLARDGPPRQRPFWSPLKELIYVLISARTRTEVSLAVLAELELRYAAALGDWRGLRDAPLAEVLHLLAPVTFSERKAPSSGSAIVAVQRRSPSTVTITASRSGSALSQSKLPPATPRRPCCACCPRSAGRPAALPRCMTCSNFMAKFGAPPTIGSRTATIAPCSRFALPVHSFLPRSARTKQRRKAISHTKKHHQPQHKRG